MDFYEWAAIGIRKYDIIDQGKKVDGVNVSPLTTAATGPKGAIVRRKSRVQSTKH